MSRSLTVSDNQIGQVARVTLRYTQTDRYHVIFYIYLSLQGVKELGILNFVAKVRNLGLTSLKIIKLSYFLG